MALHLLDEYFSNTLRKLTRLSPQKSCVLVYNRVQVNSWTFNWYLLALVGSIKGKMHCAFVYAVIYTLWF